jgi:hypothetical protein
MSRTPGMNGIRMKQTLRKPMINITSASALGELLNGAIWYQNV